ncbi:para-aminobenzoate synthetase component 1 [Georgenia satyanarayanai]|uniref:Para-aminobenzoate synthetase component 1 n=1 Tax=Georgenia satyanarayanai TaxID=860221 RepID=A0A2Y9A305_9MICO|nr:chorismate-binding protein [Georgenia satyanarayanai]PYG02068.1 para-aminobenzoate synthetase component 1 [Georgenia satyanarayanai]SSA36879.1 para-aminobenzoate synthetase component 1 [Georgenia satyanarayanai]
MRARGLVECADLRKHPEALTSGWWAVVADFEGSTTGWRFSETTSDVHDVTRTTGRSGPADGGTWVGPSPVSWRSSLDEKAYMAAVRRVRAAVREGEVYQANICRVLSAPLGSAAAEPDAAALAAVLTAGNPAPYAGTVHVPAGAAERPAWVVSASPELFLSVRDGRVVSGPIKGTATRAEDLGAKDRAENVMITDLVRNDLQRVCLPGTVEVLDLCAVEQHPGLVHLVSRVGGTLRDPLDAAGWAALLETTLPPASVSGAPKSSALRLIRELEPAPRGPYCGAVGWIDADNGRAELAVGIRTFWWTPPGGTGAGTLRFGTGAGITWGSDPQAEWRETELKAARLVALASAPPG